MRLLEVTTTAIKKRYLTTIASIEALNKKAELNIIEKHELKMLETELKKLKGIMILKRMEIPNANSN